MASATWPMQTSAITRAELPEDLASGLMKEQITGCTLDDTVDLLCYRQLHSPLLACNPWTRRPPSLDEFAALHVASCLVPCAPDDGVYPTFQHPSGFQVETKEDVMRVALLRLLSIGRGASE